MKKTDRQRLRLNLETIRELQLEAQLEQVRGGRSIISPRDRNTDATYGCTGN